MDYHDILDDDHWFSVLLRAPKFQALGPLEELGKRLETEAWDDYQRRLQEEPKELTEARAERAKQIRELVLRANDTGDPDLWHRIDRLVFGHDVPAK